MKQKALLIIFKGFSLKQIKLTFLEDKSPNSRESNNASAFVHTFLCDVNFSDKINSCKSMTWNCLFKVKTV